MEYILVLIETQKQNECPNRNYRANEVHPYQFGPVGHQNRAQPVVAAIGRGRVHFVDG